MFLLHQSEGPAKLNEVVENLRKKMSDVLKDRSQVGYYGASVKSLMWKPAEKHKTEWVYKDAGDVLHSTYTNLINPRVSLARQKVLSCDLKTVEELKQELRCGPQQLFTITAKNNTTRDGTSRCMAVALAVCSSFVVAKGKFRLVFLIETKDDLRRVTNVVTSPDWSRDSPLLLWVHTQNADDGLSAAEFGLHESWTDELTQELEVVMERNPQTHLILTHDDSVKWKTSTTFERLFGTFRAARRGSILESYERESPQQKTFIELDESTEDICDISACPLHEEFRLFTFLKRSADAEPQPCDLLDLFHNHVHMLQSAIKKYLPGDRPVAALYRDSDDEGRVALLVRISISDVAYLHELRDTMLAGLFTVRFSEHLASAVRDHCNQLPHVASAKVEAQVDLTHFAEKYEDSVFSMESLTPHQTVKLRDCEGEGDPPTDPGRQSPCRCP